MSLARWFQFDTVVTRPAVRDESEPEMRRPHLQNVILTQPHRPETKAFLQQSPPVDRARLPLTTRRDGGRASFGRAARGDRPLVARFPERRPLRRVRSRR